MVTKLFHALLLVKSVLSEFSVKFHSGFLSHGIPREQTKGVGRNALLILKGIRLESAKLLSEHPLLRISLSTLLKRQTHSQQNSKVVPILPNTTPFSTPNKALFNDPFHVSQHSKILM